MCWVAIAWVQTGRMDSETRICTCISTVADLSIASGDDVVCSQSGI